MDQFSDSWYSYQFRYCSANNSGLYIIIYYTLEWIGKQGWRKGISASQGLTYCNILLEIEQGLAEKTAEERYNQRLKQAKPVLDAMFAQANSRTAASKSALGKAFTYLKEQRPYLTNYLKDGRLKLSNNRAERSIKPFVIDRENFLFANTPKGAKGRCLSVPVSTLADNLNTSFLCHNRILLFIICHWLSVTLSLLYPAQWHHLSFAK